MMAWSIGIVAVLFTFTSRWAYDSSFSFLYPPLLAGAIVTVTAAVLWPRHKLPPFSWAYIPLAVILLFICIRCLIDGAYINGLFITMVGVSMLYLGQRFGLRLLWPIIALSVIQAISVIVVAIFYSDWSIGMDIRNGGLIDRQNYALGYAVIAIGLVAGLHLIKSTKWKSIFAGFCCLGLLFTGSPSALVFMGIIGAYAVIKRQWSKPMLRALAIVAILFGIWVASGPGWTEYDRMRDVSAMVSTGEIAHAEVWDDNLKDDPYSWGKGRLPLYRQAIETASVTGHGYALYNKQDWYPKVHNVPLVVLDQVGILAAIAWVIVTGYCLFKSRYKYLWLGLITLGLFDHITWTVFAPYWWLIVGITVMHYRQNNSYPEIRYQSELLTV